MYIQTHNLFHFEGRLYEAPISQEVLTELYLLGCPQVKKSIANSEKPMQPEEQTKATKANSK